MPANDLSNQALEFAGITPSTHPSRTGTPSIPPGFEHSRSTLPMLPRSTSSQTPSAFDHTFVAAPTNLPIAPKSPMRMEPKTAPFTPSRGGGGLQRSTSGLTAILPATPLRDASALTASLPIATPVISSVRTGIIAGTQTMPINSIQQENVELVKPAVEFATEDKQIEAAEFPKLNAANAGNTTRSASVATPAVTNLVLGKKTISAFAPAKEHVSVKSQVSSTKAATSRRAASFALNTSTTAPAVSSPSSTRDVTEPSASTATNTLSTISDFPALPPAAPTTVLASVPRAPKTLRLISTSKIETTPAEPSSQTSTPTLVTPAAPLSRQLSLMAKLDRERPSTPASELISDEASIPSTSMSRPNSPPPGPAGSRIGSAPVRDKTKSMQKKLRKELAKEKERDDVEPVKEVEPEGVGPIQGRMKKQKKDKPRTAGTISTSTSTPVASRPASPGPVVPQQKENAPPEKERKVIPEPEEPYKAIDSVGTRGRSQAQESSIVPQEHARAAEKQTLTPLEVIQALHEETGLNPHELSMLKPPGWNTQSRADIDPAIADFLPRLEISDEDAAALSSGQAVRKTVRGERLLLTPNGDCVKNLTEEEENRYLWLQEEIAAEAGPGAFVPHRHTLTSGFTLIHGRAVPNGPPNFFPRMDSGPAEGMPIDAVGKIQRDQALGYINQFVLPSLSNNSQLERALNANAMNAGGAPAGSVLHNASNVDVNKNWNMSWYNSWPSSGSEGIASGDMLPDALGASPYGTLPHAPSSNGDNGILATGIESMTAHFAVGNSTSLRGHPVGNVSLLSLPDSEIAFAQARKELEKLDKQMHNIVKRNRRILLASAGH